MDALAVRRWTAASVPRWVTRYALTLAWAGAFAAAIAGDSSVCSPDDPSVCGPDLTFAVSAVALFATPILLVVLPAMGCVAGVVFAGLDLRWDDTAAGRAAFGGNGLACAAVLVWLLIGRRRQRAVARAAAVPGPVAIPPRPLRTPLTARLIALGLFAVGCVSVGVYRHEQGATDRMLSAAVPEQAGVIGVDGDGSTITLRLPSSSGSVPVDVIDTAAYPVGAEVPVLVDRQGTTPRVVLVAEPPDNTLWLTGGLLAWALAAVLVGVDLAGRRSLARLGSAPAVVTLGDVTLDEAVLRPAEGGPPFAVVRLQPPPWTDDRGPESPYGPGCGGEPDDWDGPGEWAELTAEEVADFGRAWRGEPTLSSSSVRDRVPPEPHEVTVLGDLSEGGWVVVVDHGTLRTPSAPLRRFRSDTFLDPPAEGHPARAAYEDYLTGLDEPSPFPGEPVAAGASAVPVLPLVLRPPLGYRLAGAAMSIGLAAGPLAATLLADHWYEALALLVAGGILGVRGIVRLVVGIRLERTRLVLRTPARIHHVPWARLHGVRRLPDGLALAWTPTEFVETGPVMSAAGDPAELIMRQRALAAAAGDPGTDPTGGWTVTVPVAVAYALIAVALVVLR